MNILEAAGPAAARIASLSSATLLVATAIAVLVIGLLVFAVLRSRGEQDEPEPKARYRWIFLGTGGVVLVLVAFFLVSTSMMPGVSRPPSDPDLQVTVDGKQWWWEIRYPRADGDTVVTANEIHIPVGEPVAIRLESDDVIHSFWIPELQGKTDLVPGRTNRTWLEADEPGVYRGQCAEFCGMQHAHMAIHVVAESRDDFDRWLESHARPAEPPSDSLSRAGRDVVVNGICATCHTIRGTPALGVLAPDLTHVASRGWLAGGTIENTEEDLRDFIAHAPDLKPGIAMPEMTAELDSAQLNAAAAYLETLE